MAARLGALSPFGYLVTAVGIGAVIACLAEVASQFRLAGGPYLYARVCFGPFATIQIGWLTWLTRIVSAAAVADLFVSYLIQFLTRAIAAFSVLVFAFAELGSFRWNSLLVGVSRILIYASIAVAVPFLRKKQPDADAFRLPGAIWFVVPALEFTGGLATRIPLAAWAVAAGTSMLALLNWFWTLRQDSRCALRPDRP